MSEQPRSSPRARGTNFARRPSPFARPPDHRLPRPPLNNYQGFAIPPHPPPRIPPVEQTARVSVEKRKKGKFVTAVHGLPGVGNDLPELLTKLKNACSAGGTLKDEVIEIQGKQSERVKEVLLQLGFNVKQ